MYLFKTSGKTFDSVIGNQKHAFSGRPDCFIGEIILVSKNKTDCRQNEKQIQYIMRFEGIRDASNDEIERLWPGNSGRWRWIVDCYDTIKIENPFNLEDILGYENSKRYGPVMTFVKLDQPSEETIARYLEENNIPNGDPIPEEKELIKAELNKLNNEFNSSPPEKKEYTSDRIERNQRVVALLKKLHPKKCQICETEHFITKTKEKYSEIHHIVELSEGGSQATDNCLVICPTCHRKMHRANVDIRVENDNALEITINGEQFHVRKNVVGELFE